MVIAPQRVTPWSSVGYLTYKRTYARRLIADNPDSPTEEWNDTITRVIKAAQEQLSCGFTPEEEERLYHYFNSLKGSVAGRFLWQLGTTTVDKHGLASLQNCAFTTIDKPIRPFTWAFDMLMLGSGVGINIQREYVYKLPPVREAFATPSRLDNASADFIVPDTREGWVKLLEHTLRSAFEDSSQATFSFSTQLIRSKGAPINGFGGVASGPEDLVQGIRNIGGIIEARRGKQLRPIDCLDIINIVGSIVVAGNVRRSAIIALGDSDDIQYLRAKRWDLGNVPNWRAMSNNSVVCNDFSTLPEEFWEGYKNNGEPYGLINLKNARAFGRTGETKYKDPKVNGFNPCAEQSLEDYETCCLAEIYLCNIESKEELKDIATLLYRINKHSLRLPSHHAETEAVVHKNMRMGIGVTGVLQATEEQRSWLEDTYEHLRKYDKIYSEVKGWPTSIKLTTCKPSGTLSLLPGVTPGIHPGYARYMIRRIRIASNSPLVEVCRNHGYKVEYVRNFDGTDERGTMVVEFPFRYPDNAVLANDTTALDQLEYVKWLQTVWSDNAVSCTVYYRDEELPTIREYLTKNYNTNFKSLSFLRHSGHGFDQAPYEEINKELYDEMVANSTLITSVNGDITFEADEECATGACPIK
jgi:ribonucleotide reductase alpha subunit